MRDNVKDLAYWYSVCPICHGQGRLVIRKKNKDGRLFFNCDECESSWDDASEIGNNKKIFFGPDVPSSRASADDIKNGKWEAYAKHEYIQ